MATTTDTDPRQELAELERRILDGDDSVTSSALQKAKAAAELRDLRDEAARLQTEREADERREREAEAFRAEITEAARGLTNLQTTYSSLVVTCRTLMAQLKEWQSNRRDLALRAKAFGMVDEIDAALPQLDRDWVGVAVSEAAGQLPARGGRSSNNGFRLGLVFHELHDAAARQRLEVDNAAEAEAAAQRHRDREVQRQRDEAQRQRDINERIGQDASA